MIKRGDKPQTNMVVCRRRRRRRRQAKKRLDFCTAPSIQ